MKYEQVSVDPHGFKFKGCHISNGTVSGWNFNLYQGSRRFKSLEDPSAIQWPGITAIGYFWGRAWSA